MKTSILLFLLTVATGIFCYFYCREPGYSIGLKGVSSYSSYEDAAFSRNGAFGIMIEDKNITVIRYIYAKDERIIEAEMDGKRYYMVDTLGLLKPSSKVLDE